MNYLRKVTTVAHLNHDTSLPFQVGITFQIRRKAGLEERAQEWFKWVRANNGKHPCARIPIGKWAMDQRKKWSLWKDQGIKCNLTQEFVDRLAEGGFPWQL